MSEGTERMEELTAFLSWLDEQGHANHEREAHEIVWEYLCFLESRSAEVAQHRNETEEQRRRLVAEVALAIRAAEEGTFNDIPMWADLIVARVLGESEQI